MTVEIQSANDQRAGLLNAFYSKYKYKLDPTTQPSGQTLSILLKPHKRKYAEFIPLSKVSNAFGNKDFKSEPTRIKGTSLLIEQNGLGKVKRSSFNPTPRKFRPHREGAHVRVRSSVGERPSRGRVVLTRRGNVPR